MILKSLVLVSGLCVKCPLGDLVLKSVSVIKWSSWWVALLGCISFSLLREMRAAIVKGRWELVQFRNRLYLA